VVGDPRGGSNPPFGTILTYAHPTYQASGCGRQAYGRKGVATLHIMEDLKINNLACNDSDFDRVTLITLYKPSIIPMP
jgi:hypothetical protein